MNMTVARLTARSLLGRKRVWLLLPLPVILIGMALAGHLAQPYNTDWVPTVVHGIGFGVVVPVLALIIGSSVVGSEIDDGTIVHILTKPVPRTEILLAKLAVAAVVTSIVSGIAMFVAGTLAVDSRFGVALAVGAVVASICYCALFIALSIMSRRPVLIGLAYILIWEGLLGNLLTGTRSLSIEQYALTLADKANGENMLASTVSVTTAILMSIVFLVGGTALAIDRLRSFTLAGETS
jgi:ABC-2 type transport system permease protein